MGDEKPKRIKFYPFAYALLTEELENYCWYCLDDNQTKRRCLGCGLAVFCGTDCQQLGWKDHKAECLAFRTARHIPDIEVRILGRIVIRHKDIESGKDKKDPNFYKERTSERTIMQIWAHTEKMKKDRFAMGRFEDVYTKLSKFYAAKHMLPKDTVFELHCRNYINRHAISDKGYMREIGKGLYLDLCAYDHSCRPNAIYSCTGTVATLRALDNNVDIYNRKTTFYSYIELICSQQERQKLLRDTWYFECQCDRCTDPEDHMLTSVKCPHCPSDKETRLAIFGTPPYKNTKTSVITCPSCTNELSREYVLAAINNMRFIDGIMASNELAQMTKKDRISFLEDLLERNLKVFPTINVYLSRLIQNLIPLVNAADHATLLKLHLMSEECVRWSFPHNHPAVAFHLRNIGIFYQGVNDKINSVKYISEAQSILEYTLDADHPMTIENKDILEQAIEQAKLVTKHIEKKVSELSDAKEISKQENTTQEEQVGEKPEEPTQVEKAAEKPQESSPKEQQKIDEKEKVVVKQATQEGKSSKKNAKNKNKKTTQEEPMVEKSEKPTQAEKVEEKAEKTTEDEKQETTHVENKENNETTKDELKTGKIAPDLYNEDLDDLPELLDN